MDTKYSLKGCTISPYVNEIKKELHDLGFNTRYYYGNFYSLDDESKLGVAVDAETFNHVCIMLYKTRMQLQAERKKKWWMFWK